MNFLELYGEEPLVKGRKFIVAAGVFDGVHQGHRRIIRAAAERAAQCNAAVMALTFDPHPRSLFAAEPPRLLLSTAERVRQLVCAGADRCCFVKFTAEIAALEPEDFLVMLKGNDIFEVCGICVGKNWRFGKGGSGDRRVLEQFCNAHSWSCDCVEEVVCRGETVSSTAVRNAVCCGDLDYAAEMLGRPAAVYGYVAHGKNIAGKNLDAPTANIEVAAGVLPPNGVYSGAVSFGDARYPAVLNIGVSPTYNGTTRRFEVHLIGFSGSLYGEFLTVELLRFIRPERRFPSEKELKEQIVRDISAAAEFSDLQKT